MVISNLNELLKAKIASKIPDRKPLGSEVGEWIQYGTGIFIPEGGTYTIENMVTLIRGSGLASGFIEYKIGDSGILMVREVKFP